jgi:hypothetical protein
MLKKRLRLTLLISMWILQKREASDSSINFVITDDNNMSMSPIVVDGSFDETKQKAKILVSKWREHFFPPLDVDS